MEGSSMDWSLHNLQFEGVHVFWQQNVSIDYERSFNLWLKWKLQAMI